MSSNGQLFSQIANRFFLAHRLRSMLRGFVLLVSGLLMGIGKCIRGDSQYNDSTETILLHGEQGAMGFACPCINAMPAME